MTVGAWKLVALVELERQRESLTEAEVVAGKCDAATSEFRHGMGSHCGAPNWGNEVRDTSIHTAQETPSCDVRDSSESSVSQRAIPTKQ